VSIGLTKEQFLEMYNVSTKNKFDVLIINLENSGNERYRKNFLQYFEIEYSIKDFNKRIKKMIGK
jgi:hypothetical protein